MNKISKALLIVIGLTGLGTAQAGKVSGEMAAQTCAGCHGTHGYIENSAFMPLAGMSEEHFINAMNAFANGSRPNTLMGPIAMAFSDEEIRAMAEYFAQFPKERGDQQ